MFEGLDLGSRIFADRSYFLHVFVVPETEAEAFEVPLVAVPREEHVYYAGSSSIFGGKGDGCANCGSGKLTDVLVDVTKKLRRDLRLKRRDAILKVMAVDADTDELIQLDETTSAETGVPLPRLVGPWWRDADDSAETDAESSNAVLRRLKATGFYDGDVSVPWSDDATDALKGFQDANGLENSGVVDKRTRLALRRPRHDGWADVGPAPAKREGAVETLKYRVSDNVPGYLDRDAVLGELAEAFGAWSDASGVEFIRTDDDSADVTVSWSAPSAVNFDGPGGCLAKADEASVTFDGGEVWRLQGSKPKRNAFFLLPVALHEIGHVRGGAEIVAFGDATSPRPAFAEYPRRRRGISASRPRRRRDSRAPNLNVVPRLGETRGRSQVLGLTHSRDPAAVMSPYYVANRIELTEDDVERVRMALAAE